MRAPLLVAREYSSIVFFTSSTALKILQEFHYLLLIFKWPQIEIPDAFLKNVTKFIKILKNLSKFNKNFKKFVKILRKYDN